MLFLSLIGILSLLITACGAPGDPVTDDIYSQDLFPGTAHKYNVGSAKYPYKNGYFDNLFIDGDEVLGGAGSTSGESENIVVMPGNVANATVNLTNATGMTFNANANSTYIIECFIVWDSSLTTVGIKLSATASGSFTITSGNFIAQAANGTPDGSSYNANDVVITTSDSAFTTNNFGELHAILVTSGSTSTWQLRFAAETTGTITLKAGTTLRYRKVA